MLAIEQPPPADPPLARRYVMLNKPAGFVTARQTNNGRSAPTVYEVLAAAGFQTDIGYAGRLDTETEGLLLFTDDGRLLQAMTNHHPAAGGRSAASPTHVPSLPAWAVGRPADGVKKACNDWLALSIWTLLLRLSDCNTS